MPTICLAESGICSTGQLTHTPLRLMPERHFHTAFCGDTGFGKSVAAERLACETTRQWRFRSVVLDFGQGWRRALNWAGLMPREMPHIPGYDLAGAWHPALEVAGDFYDIFPLDGGCWGMMIGDVADKGTAAALYMAMAHSLILSEALRHRNPAAVLMEVNRTILRQSSSGIFVTVFLAVLDPQKGTLQCANAGHNPPVVRRASGEKESLTLTGSVVSILKDLQLSDATITLESGDAVVLYTDGVTEAWNSSDRDEEYGDYRLTAAVTAAPRKAGELLAYVEADLNIFTKGAPPQDDVTFLVLTKD